MTAVNVHAVQRRSIGVLSTGQILGGVAVAGSIPAGGLLAASVSGSEGAAGLVQTAGVVGAAVLALPLARIALTHGRRPALALGYALGALGALIVIAGAVTRSLPVILAGAFFVGVASAASYQARYAAADLAEPSTVGRSLSWVVWAGTVGAVLGPNLLNASGRLAMSMGLPQLAGPYVVAGLALACAGLVLALFLRPDPYLLSLELRAASGDRPTGRPRLRDGIEHLRGRPRAVFGIAVIAVGHAVMVMVMVMTPVHMSHVDVSLQLIGLVISVHVAGMYALSPLVGFAVDRVGRMPVVWTGLAILAAACVISGLAPADSVVTLGIGLFLLGLGWSCTLIAGSSIVTAQTDATERPAVQGLSDLTMNVAGAAGGIVAGVIVAWLGYGWLCAVALVPVGALALVAASTRQRSTA